MKQKRLVIVSGPTASGKDVVVAKLLARFPVLKKVTTATTRPKRQGEREGRSYVFLTKETFRKAIRKKHFLEWALVHGNYYGTPKARVDHILRDRRIPILVIDVQGAIKIKKKIPETFTLFLYPFPKQRYFARIKRDRGKEQNFHARIQSIKRELVMAKGYDRVVFNREGELRRTIAAVQKHLERYLKSS